MIEVLSIIELIVCYVLYLFGDGFGTNLFWPGTELKENGKTLAKRGIWTQVSGAFCCYVLYRNSKRKDFYQPTHYMGYCMVFYLITFVAMCPVFHWVFWSFPVDTAEATIETYIHDISGIFFTILNIFYLGTYIPLIKLFGSISVWLTVNVGEKALLLLVPLYILGFTFVLNLVGTIHMGLIYVLSQNKSRIVERDEKIAPEFLIRDTFEAWSKQFTLLKDTSVENYIKLSEPPYNLDHPSATIRSDYEKTIENLRFNLLMEYTNLDEQLEIADAADPRIIYDYTGNGDIVWGKFDIKKWTEYICDKYIHEDLMKNAYTEKKIPKDLKDFIEKLRCVLLTDEEYHELISYCLNEFSVRKRLVTKQDGFQHIVKNGKHYYIPDNEFNKFVQKFGRETIKRFLIVDENNNTPLKFEVNKTYKVLKLTNVIYGLNKGLVEIKEIDSNRTRFYATASYTGTSFKLSNGETWNQYDAGLKIEENVVTRIYDNPHFEVNEEEIAQYEYIRE